MTLRSYFSNRKKIDYKRPVSFKDLISKENYKVIVNLVLEYARNIGKVESVHDGIVILVDKKTKAERIISLNNIVRRCIAYEAHRWDKMIDYHFKQLIVNPTKLNFFYKDFEFAAQYLKVFVLPIEKLDDIDSLIYREDFPNTRTFLILDYDEKFHYVQREKSLTWGKTETELFDLALANISLENIEIDQFLWKDKYEVFSLFNGDFSAAFIIDFAKNVSFAIGKYGTIVAIPTKGAVFLHPLSSNQPEPFIQSFQEVVQSFYQEDEEPITMDFYWFWEGEFKFLKDK